MRQRLSRTSVHLHHREELLLRVEQLTELPLLVLSFVMIPLLLGPILWDLSETEDAVFFALDSLIWALFAADIAVKIAITPHRLDYARAHWLEILVVAIPFARPLRIIRLVIFGSRAIRNSRRLANIDFLLVYALGLIIIAATVVTSVESGHEGGIQTFPDALWWSLVTVTTVGYGDMTPVTAAGRSIAVFLMIGGIGLFGGLTANLASLFIRAEDPSSTAISDLATEVQRLRSEIARLRAERDN